MQLSYKDWLDKTGNKRLDKLKESIEELDIPQNFKNEFLQKIEDNAYNICEEWYIDDISSYQDQAYDEYKDRDI